MKPIGNSVTQSQTISNYLIITQKAEYGGSKYCSKTSHLFLSSSQLLPRSHNFFENITADTGGKKQSAPVRALALVDYLLVCLWTSARAELMTGASQGNTSIALPLFTSQNSWTINKSPIPSIHANGSHWEPQKLQIFHDRPSQSSRATIGQFINQSLLQAHTRTLQSSNKQTLSIWEAYRMFFWLLFSET